MSKGVCGTITWRVAGHINGRVAILNATKPEPSVDKCGATVAASIAVVRTPYCNTTELGK